MFPFYFYQYQLPTGRVYHALNDYLVWGEEICPVYVVPGVFESIKLNYSSIGKSKRGEGKLGEESRLRQKFGNFSMANLLKILGFHL